MVHLVLVDHLDLLEYLALQEEPEKLEKLENLYVIHVNIVCVIHSLTHSLIHSLTCTLIIMCYCRDKKDQEVLMVDLVTLAHLDNQERLEPLVDQARKETR